MSDIRRFIMELRERGIRLVLDGGQLKSRSAPGAIDATTSALIRARKDEIVAFLDARQGEGTEQGDRGPVPGDGPRPLSFAQQRLWFIDRLEGSVRYVIPLALEVRGSLDRMAAQAAVSAIVRRHESLRTVIHDDDGEPVQVVSGTNMPLLGYHDLRGFDPVAREARIAVLVRDNRDLPFDLRRDPMLRMSLLQVEDDAWIVLAAMHHIASDGWSINVFLREFSDAYDQAVSGRDIVMEPLPVQYADFAAWQRRRAGEGRMDAQVAWWRDTLADIPQVHGIPLDHTRPPRKGSLAHRVTARVDRATTAALRELGRSADATLFMVLHAAMVAVLSRWGRGNDIVMGTPVSGRGHESLAPLIGYFSNTVVLRVGTEGVTDFHSLVATCRRTCLGAYEHQDVPLDRVVDALRVERSASFTPVFQILFSMPNVDHRQLRCAGLDIAVRSPSTVASMFDLDIAIVEDNGELAIRWDADRALFDESTVRRMMTAYRRVLDAMVADPAQPVTALDLVDASDLVRMSELNGDVAAYEKDAQVHQLVARQAQATPSRIAVACGDQTWTYAEFDGMANTIASDLVDAGVKPGDVVPVVMMPGVEVPLAFLAIMKAGAAFAPIDAHWPTERRRRAIEALGSPIVVLAAPTADAIGIPCMVVEVDRSRVGPDPRLAQEGDALIYAMHTSGSTGIPKAALNLHKGIVNRLQYMSRAFGEGDDEVVLQTTHHCFDSAVWQFFWPLIKGGTTVVPRIEGPFDVAEVGRLLADRSVTFTDFTPALLGMFLDHLADHPALRERIRLRDIVVGGEETTPALARRCAELLPSVRLHNFYGPSETSIGAIRHTLSREFTGPVPIGRPIDNVTVAIVDETLRPVPFGAAGEILLGGDCVGAGYVGMPEATERAFVDLDRPLFGRTRFYRTGDLARYRADGEIEFLGRIDAQVKIRGFRIEPGEIQSALESLAGVRQAHVRVNGDGAARRLVAYVAGDVDRSAGTATAVAALRAQLALRLPDYMVPSAMVLLDRLPMTPGGKIDSRSLPEPEGVGASSRSPATEEERAIAAIWRELFATTEVGADDDFFERGGHSLVAMRVAVHLRKTWGIDVPLAKIFEHTRLSDLASWCASARRPDFAEA